MNMATWTKRILLTLVALVVLILAAAILIPVLFKDKIEAAVKKEVNNSINAVVDWGDWDITILKSFPDLTVEIENVKVSFTGEPGPSVVDRKPNANATGCVLECADDSNEPEGRASATLDVPPLISTSTRLSPR